MNRSIIIMLGVASIFLSGCYHEDKKSTWYDYGNGMINLSNVSRINSEMTMTLVLTNLTASGSNQEIEIANGVISESEVSKIINSITEYDGQVSAVRSYAAIYFDNFTLQLQDFDSADIDVSEAGCIALSRLWLYQYLDLQSQLLGN